MKNILPTTHLLLLFVAAILYPSIKKDPNNELVFAEWQLITAGVQLLSAAFLSFRTRPSRPLQKLLGIYWIAAGGTLALVGFCGNTGAPGHILFLYVLHWCIAAYFTMIVFLSSYSKYKTYNYEK